MRKYFNIKFVDYATERAIKTLIQALFAAGLIGGGIFDMNWPEIISLAGGTSLASVMTSFVFYRGDGTDDPDDTTVLDGRA